MFGSAGTPGRLALLLGAALAWRLLLFVGPQGSDDLAYSEHARALSAGDYRPVPDIFALRVGYIGPIALIYATVGAGPLQLVLVNLAASLAGIALTFLVARRLVEERGAWIAAALVAATPIDVHLATEAHTDMPLGALTTASVLLLLGAREKEDPRRFFAAGLVLGLGHLVKESAFLALPLLLLLAGRSWRRILILLGGFAAPILLEMAAYGAALGDPFFRITSTRTVQARAMEALLGAHGGSGARLVDALRGLLDPSRCAVFGLLVPVAAAGAILAIGGRERRLAPALLWSVIVLALLLLWPVTLVPYRPAVAVHPRIFQVVVPPLAILAAFAVLRIRSRPAAGAVLALLGFAAVGGALLMHADARAVSAGARVAWDHLGDARVVVSDPRTIGLFRLYDGYRVSRRWALWDETVPEKEAVWVVNRTMIRRLREWYGTTPPAGFPPPDAAEAVRKTLPVRRRIRDMLSGINPPPEGDAVILYRPPAP